MGEPGGPQELLEELMTHEPRSERACTALARAERDCREVAERIQGDIVKELTAICLSLSIAADTDDLDRDPRAALEARRRSVQQCTRLLAAVAEQLAPGVD